MNKKIKEDKPKIDNVANIKNSLKQLNEYMDMLLTGEHPTDYIVKKIEVWAQNVITDAPHADKQIKEQRKKYENKTLESPEDGK